VTQKYNEPLLKSAFHFNCASHYKRRSLTQKCNEPQSPFAFGINLRHDTRQCLTQKYNTFAFNFNFGRYKLDNTIIIVVSDNGASGEGGLGGTYNEIQTLNKVATTAEVGRCRLLVPELVTSNKLEFGDLAKSQMTFGENYTNAYLLQVLRFTRYYI
jgi:hypothetical protein